MLVFVLLLLCTWTTPSSARMSGAFIANQRIFLPLSRPSICPQTSCNHLAAKPKAGATDSDEVLQRQRTLTDAMNLLSDWDEEQQAFVLKYADANAPLGDWRGLRKVLDEEERVEMQRACKILCEEAAYVLVGLNAESESEALEAFREWITRLELPMPESVPYMDDISGLEYNSLEEMPEDFRLLLKGAVHIAYNSKAGADPVTGDDSMAPAKAHLMPYPAPDRGVVFTPILEGFFTQYGDIPLDLFSTEDAETRRLKYTITPRRTANLAAEQQAAIGNAEAAKILLQRASQAPPQDVSA
jgi:hypothetical protein